MTLNSAEVRRAVLQQHALSLLLKDSIVHALSLDRECGLLGGFDRKVVFSCNYCVLGIEVERVNDFASRTILGFLRSSPTRCMNFQEACSKGCNRENVSLRFLIVGVESSLAT